MQYGADWYDHRNSETQLAGGSFVLAVAFVSVVSRGREEHAVHMHRPCLYPMDGACAADHLALPAHLGALTSASPGSDPQAVHELFGMDAVRVVGSNWLESKGQVA